MSNVIALQQARRHVRVPCDARAQIVCEGQVLEVRCRNLSIGGAWLDGGAFPSGSPVEVTLWLPGSGAVQAQGTVRRSQDHGMGVQFHRIEPGDLVQLHRFVAHRFGVLDAA